MLCDICKNRQASVHLTEIINDEVTELHICEECARKKGISMQQQFGIADLLSGLVDLPGAKVSHKAHIKIKCPSCGMTYENFKKLGRFGCEDCYEAFKRALYPLLKKIHGTTRHAGKEPQKGVPNPVKKGKKIPRASVKPKIDEIGELKNRLTKAVEQEEFEQAAILRDKIRALEGKKT